MSQGEHGHEPPKTYHYFVDDVKYETTQPTITGAMIKAKIENFDPTYSLFQEGHGNDPDLQINDDTTVSLTGTGPLRFYTVPPATFGNR
jgi:hypothetical protein